MEELSNLRTSFELVKKHKIMFLPNLFIIISNTTLILLLYLTLYFLGINIYSETLELSTSLIISLLLTLLLMALVDNFFTCSKYGMIKDIIKKGKTSLSSGFSFGKKYFITSLKIHLIVYMLLLLPVFVVTIIITELSYGIFLKTLLVTLLIFYLIYISLRLLFVFPIMAFEEKGAYYSFKEGFHYIKLHLQHNIMTWIFVVGIALSFSLVKQMIKEELVGVASVYVGLTLLGLAVLTLIEIGVSLWEHMFVFKAYIVGKKEKENSRIKKKQKKERKVVSKKSSKKSSKSKENIVKKKITKNKVAKKKVVKKAAVKKKNK